MLNYFERRNYKNITMEKRIKPILLTRRLSLIWLLTFTGLKNILEQADLKENVSLFLSF
jgi:hypothetical protein